MCDQKGLTLTANFNGKVEAFFHSNFINKLSFQLKFGEISNKSVRVTRKSKSFTKSLYEYHVKHFIRSTVSLCNTSII